MKTHYQGLDLLRGLGIFILIWMHSAFYYFDGLYDLDFANPPPIVTLIGLMLMFAGLFAMISGTAHGIQYFRKTGEQGYTRGKLLKYNTVNALLMLAVAWLYFILTGPGLVDMANKTMNNSILVDLIRNGIWKGFNLERFLYVDSLVMIGLNLLLLGPLFILLNRRKHPTGIPILLNHRKHPTGIPNLLNRRKHPLPIPSLAGTSGKDPGKPASCPWLISGLAFFLLSLFRIPLYAVYTESFGQGRHGMTLLLNWLVNKNNPLMPYLSFGLLGAWMGFLLVRGDWKGMVRQVLPVGTILLAAGVVLYVQLPDTMLERSIDGKWFSIMTAQLGLFLLLVLLMLRLFDFRKSGPVRKLPSGLAFLNRFGVAGLTAFFFESVVSASIFRILRVFVPALSLDLPGSLLYGFSLAVLWGFLLILWEKRQYRYGIEYALCRLLAPFGHSAKQDKLARAGTVPVTSGSDAGEPS